MMNRRATLSPVDFEIAATIRTLSPVDSIVTAAGNIATALTGPVNTVVSGIVTLTASVPYIFTVTADNLPELPNFTHSHGTVAYCIEQLDELKRLLQAERKCDGIFPSNQAPHLT